MHGHSFGLILAALGLALAVPIPAAAQPANTQAAPVSAADKPYLDLYDAMVGGFDMGVLVDAGADAIFDGLVRNEPTFAELSRKQPDLKVRFRTMTRPYLRPWMERGFQVRRGAFVVKAKPLVTPAEAGELAAFYNSPLGKKIMGSVASNLTLDDTLDKTMQSGDYKGISSKDESRMVDGALGDLFKTLTADEQAEMIELSARPAFRKLPMLTNALKSIPEPTMEEISTPQEREAFSKDVRSFLGGAMAKN